MNIKIVTTEPFPFGLAATNRILSYAKGFIMNNCKITVICVKPTENWNKVINDKSFGEVDGTKFFYSCGSTIRSKNFFSRRLQSLIGIVRLCYILLFENNKTHTDAIIYYSSSTSKALILYLITRIKGIHLLKEESEHSDVYLMKMGIVNKLLFKSLHYHLFDGYLLMTHKIIEHITLDKKIKKPFLHVPMTVDFERFKNLINNSENKYIAYCGLLNNEKDGIDILINAFSRLNKEFPEIYLYLIGRASSFEEQKLYDNMVNDLKIKSKVIFTGNVVNDKIPELLHSSIILILPRPNSKQANSGFPTKLGEYLASQKPVIATKVGEIPSYFKDGESIFFAEPGNIDSLYNKITEILRNYENAMKIAVKGYNIALENFDCNKQTKSIVSFIKGLK